MQGHSSTESGGWAGHRWAAQPKLARRYCGFTRRTKSRISGLTRWGASSWGQLRKGRGQWAANGGPAGPSRQEDAGLRTAAHQPAQKEVQKVYNKFEHNAPRCPPVLHPRSLPDSGQRNKLLQTQARRRAAVREASETGAVHMLLSWGGKWGVETPNPAPSNPCSRSLSHTPGQMGTWQTRGPTQSSPTGPPRLQGGKESPGDGEALQSKRFIWWAVAAAALRRAPGPCYAGRCIAAAAARACRGHSPHTTLTGTVTVCSHGSRCKAAQWVIPHARVGAAGSGTRRKRGSSRARV